MILLAKTGIVLLGYLLGAIPFGFLVVRWGTGKDIRQVASGRTGGTNAFRAAGAWAGILTGVLDVAKGALSVWLARAFFPEDIWVQTLAPLAAIMGHNYSIYLIERNEKGRIQLRGGAGAAPFAGGALAFWPPSILIVLVLGALIWYFVGYASVTTMSAALIVTVIFILRFFNAASPWQYILYGFIGELLLLWALRPNIRRLIQGNERLVGWRARRKSSPEQ